MSFYTLCRPIQEKPTNCGTKAADVLDKFVTRKRNANPLNIWVHLQMTPQCLSFKGVANPFATAWP